MFIYLVNIMNNMVGGRIIEVIFYICILLPESVQLSIYMKHQLYFYRKNLVNRIVATLIIHIVGCVVAIGIQAIVLIG